MRNLILPLVFVALLLPAVMAADKEAGEKPWLDLQGCAICKHMGAQMDMMQDVTWETHKIDNGMLNASYVPEEYRAKMAEVHQKMLGTAAQLVKGEELPLCGFCQSYGKLKMAGASSKDIPTQFGMIGLLTSDDPEVVKQIHAHADRTIAEYKKFLAAQPK